MSSVRERRRRKFILFFIPVCEMKDEVWISSISLSIEKRGKSAHARSIAAGFNIYNTGKRSEKKKS